MRRVSASAIGVGIEETIEPRRHGVEPFADAPVEIAPIGSGRRRAATSADFRDLCQF
jgi:hypothetical protein